MKISKNLKIHGKVQGVFFRESMLQEALRLGVTGWVRNKKDGTVEAVVQGEEILVADLVKWCHHGPPSARVDKVESADASNEPALGQFLRKETQ